MSTGESIISQAREALDLEEYRQQHWTGSFAEYLDLVRSDPRVARTAFERIYDMVLAAGSREYLDNKKKIIHYNFFDDPRNGGRDSIYGLDIPLMKLRPRFDPAHVGIITPHPYGLGIIHSNGQLGRVTLQRVDERRMRQIVEVYAWPAKR